MSKIRSAWVGGLAAIGILTQFLPSARSQGLIVDVRPGVPISRSYEIREVSIDGRVRDQVAEVHVSQTFHNPGSFQLEAEFLFPLPDEGVVQNFVLMVDGRELPGRLLRKDEARRIYEEIVRTKRDPALLEYVGRGLFRTSVFPIPPGADRKVTMRYTQLCKRDRDIVEFAYPLATQKFTAKPIQRLAVQVSIQSRESIKSVYCPSDDVRIERFGDHEARVGFERRDVLPGNDFRLLYTLAEGAVSATVLSYRPNESEDGYFLLLASPEIKAPDTKPLPKTVIFVIDRSGSMAGKKIEQARNALKAVLNNLREDDLFNIVVYDDRVESFKPELERYRASVRAEAERFVDNIREGGSTNIDAALKVALASIKDTSRPSYVLFLTDGLPTVGETRELAIADEARRANEHRARIFCFGVGYDVNARLLDRLSGGNSGSSEYVKPDEDIETHFSRIHSKMTRPVLADLRLELTGIDVNRTYPRDLPDLVEGSQLVWAGRYRQSGRTTVRLTGKVGAEHRTLEFPAELAHAYTGSSYDFVERLWAARRIGDLIDQIDLHGQNRELVDELVSLSSKYGILTPYTAFLADERVQLFTLGANADQTRLNLEGLNQVSGQAGVAQREMKQSLMRAARAPALSDQPHATAFQFGRAVDRAVPRLAERSAGAGAAGAMAGGVQRGQSPQGRSRGRADSSRELIGDGETDQRSRQELAAENGPASADADHAAAKPDQAKVRQLGAKTFYWKNERWTDSTVTPEEDAKAIVITQLTDEHFRLARDQKAEDNQYLSLSEPVTVKLNGKVYHIEPARDVAPSAQPSR